MKYKFTLVLLLTSFFYSASAQLSVSPYTTAQALAQKLTGVGVTVTNVVYTGVPQMSGYFNNNNGLTNIGLDSGIVLTSGTANAIAGPSTSLASTGNSLPGDAQLAAAIGQPVSNVEDAAILEFDFVPLGDTINFQYVFSSEEYTSAFVCSFNDAFAFFISGPGIVGSQNIALVPGTTTPVSIRNVNNVIGGGCPMNMAYFINNTGNAFFSHQGHTTILTAISAVQPCQTYHLKLVIADVGDDIYDTGVFLKAGSLSSNAYTIQNITQYDTVNANSYLVEGCVPGQVKIIKSQPSSFSQTINLEYGGTALNTIDVQTLPASITIPAGQTEGVLDINPIIDNIPEGIETVVIYTLAPCAVGPGVRTDSTTLQIRDFDIMNIIPDTAYVCRNGSQQLNAPTTYSTYTWDPDPTLSSTTVSNPIASPVSLQTTYYCTATIGTCNARDSAYMRLKDIEFISKIDVNCANGNTGQIRVAAGFEWAAPVQFQLDNGTFQSDSTFNNVSIGSHFIKVRDASGCLDSIPVTVDQAYADLEFTNVTTPGSCDNAATGKIKVTGMGGLGPYQYQLGNGPLQSADSFAVAQGTYVVTVVDVNGCSKTDTVQVGYTNNLQLSVSNDTTICESQSAQLHAYGTADSYAWYPAGTLTGSNTANPIATPQITTDYIVRATRGVCVTNDTVTVFVNPAPIPDAGIDTSVCFGGTVGLQASGGASYTWTPSTYLSSTTVSNPNVVRPLSNITYSVSAISPEGCPSLITDEVNVEVTPSVRIFAGLDTVIAENQPVQLQAYETNNSGVTQWSWTPASGLDNPSISNPVATLAQDQTYLVTGITPDGCEGTDSIKVRVYKGPTIYVPSAFTPNGDGRNDLLRAIAVGMKETRYFTIFNRWGETVFTTADFRRGWDGRLKGAFQVGGSFVWIAEAVDFTGKIVQAKGTFILLR